MEFYPGVDVKRERTAELSWSSSLAVGAAVTLFAMFCWAAIFRDYWVMQEARFYFSGENHPTFSLFTFLLAPSGANARPASMWFAGVATDFFGPNVAWVNLLQIGLLGIGLFLLFLHSLQITANIYVSLFALALTLLSSAVADMLLWQATQHDKLMIIFATAALILNFYVVSAAEIRWSRLLAFSLTILLSVAIANNAKETAMFIPAALAAQYALFRRKDAGALSPRLVPIVLVAAYDLYFYAYYFSHIAAAWDRHISGGNLLGTSSDLLAYLFSAGNFMNLGEWGRAQAVHATCFWGIIAAAAGLLLVRVTNRPAELGPRWKAGVYFIVIAAAVFAISTRTSHPNAYYMLLPQWAFGILLGLLAVPFGDAAANWRNIAAISLFAILFVAQALSFSAYFLDGGAGRRLLVASRGLQDSAAAIRLAAPLGRQGTIQIGYSEPMDGSWFLLMGGGQNIDPHLAAFIYRTPTHLAPKVRAAASDSLDGCKRFELDKSYQVSLPPTACAR